MPALAATPSCRPNATSFMKAIGDIGDVWCLVAVGVRALRLWRSENIWGEERQQAFQSNKAIELPACRLIN